MPEQSTYRYGLPSVPWIGTDVALQPARAAAASRRHARRIVRVMPEALHDRGAQEKRPAAVQTPAVRRRLVEAWRLTPGAACGSSAMFAALGARRPIAGRGIAVARRRHITGRPRRARAADARVLA